MIELVEALKAAIRPTMALVGYVIASIVLVFAWWNGLVSLETALGVWLAPAALYGVDRTYTKHQAPKGGSNNA